MDLSVLYGGAHLHSPTYENLDGTGSSFASSALPQSCQELHFGYRESGGRDYGRALNHDDIGAHGNDIERSHDVSSLHGASKPKGGPRKMLPGPQQKGPVNMKRGYRQVLLMLRQML